MTSVLYASRIASLVKRCKAIDAGTLNSFSLEKFHATSRFASKWRHTGNEVSSHDWFSGPTSDGMGHREDSSRRKRYRVFSCEVDRRFTQSDAPSDRRHHNRYQTGHGRYSECSEKIVRRISKFNRAPAVSIDTKVIADISR